MYHITGEYGLLILLALLGGFGIFGTYGLIKNYLSYGKKRTLYCMPLFWMPFIGYFIVLVRTGYFEYILSK
jgi:hypothetical protein